MSRLRLAFVGLGTMGQCAHLRNYAIDPECEIIAAAEPREELARLVAARYGIQRLYRDHRELLAAEKELDGIVAIQQYQSHGSIVPELLEAKLPVLIEKPIAGSAEAAGKVLAAQQRTGTPLFIGYHKRSDPAVMHARRRIDAWQRSGELGRMKYVRITIPPGNWVAAGFCTLIRTGEAAPPLRRDLRPAGWDEQSFKRFDAFANYYIHQINLMRHLMGEDYQVMHADPTGTVMVVRSAGGIAGTLEMDPYRTTVDWQETALVTFEKAWIRLKLPPPLAIDRPGRITIFEDADGRRPQTIAPSLPHIHAMRQQAVQFVQAIRGESTSLCGPEEAAADLHIAEDYMRKLFDAEKQWARGPSQP